MFRYRDPQLQRGGNYEKKKLRAKFNKLLLILMLKHRFNSQHLWFDRLIKEVENENSRDQQDKIKRKIIIHLTLVLLNCFNCIFRHLKLELQTQFPASNDEKYRYFFKNIHVLNWVILLTEHLPQTVLSISVTYYLAENMLKTVYIRV